MGFGGRAERDVLKGSLSLIGASLSCCSFPGRVWSFPSTSLHRFTNDWITQSQRPIPSFEVVTVADFGYYALLFRGDQTSSLKEAKEPMCLGFSLPSFCHEKEE